MIDPMTAAPALYAEAHSPEWVTSVGKRTYETQAEANAGSIASNLAGAASVIREIAANPAMLGNQQVTTELDARLGYLHGVSEILAGRGVDRRGKLMVDLKMVGPFGQDEREAEALIAEVDAPLELSAQVAALRAALELLGPRPEPEIDPETVAQLAWIRKHVAPRRQDACIVPIEMPEGAGFLDKLAIIAAMDESGDEGHIAELVDWVPTEFEGEAADA